MQKLFCIAMAVAMMPAASIAQNKPPIPAQAARGRELFQKTTKGIPCATCHSMGGLGTAIGPDLSKMANAPPRGIVSTMHMSMTEYVQEVKTVEGTFPGMLKQKQDDESEIWDLSQTPPALRKLTSKQIVSMKRDQKWKHPPSIAEYTSQELADIVGFLKWAATGSVKEIKPDEVE